ncbi:polysaccharide deacetylase family protein [Mycolicibacterium houstonense]|uniref:polysaccharide deacetylase family protein n=1 Tax=Mycolicibacterium houstonense TaxID=146021 RepID=UPI000835CFDB|nr:polysaccharide deacetylase family protein [Mycolicibacterium houstonense]MCV7065718.1 polysaccharide deacetylase family protein [Mycolicibacterium farcinogenes]
MRRWLWGVAVALVVILGVTACGYCVSNARTFQLAGRLVDRVETPDKVVALTLDDGPTDLTPEVLKILADVRVPATFYLTGRELDAAPEHGAAIWAAGHEIGNHSYSHQRMVLMSPGTVADEIERTDAAIRATGYQGPITFRPPYGKKLWTLPRYLSTHDRTSVTWDVEPDSATEADADAIVAETVSRVRPGSIILLHVMYGSRAASRSAIPRIVDELRSAGYRFVTVSDLLASR